MIPPPSELFRDSFELNGDEAALAALTASEDTFRASLYPLYCHDNTHYHVEREFTDWRDWLELFNKPLRKVWAEPPSWIYNVLTTRC